MFKIFIAKDNNKIVQFQKIKHLNNIEHAHACNKPKD